MNRGEHHPEALRLTRISSHGSCTTNSAASVVEVLRQRIGARKAILNTVHAYTAMQSLVDGPVHGRDLRRGSPTPSDDESTGGALNQSRPGGGQGRDYELQLSTDFCRGLPGNLFRNVRSARGLRKLRAVVITIEIALVAEQPLFAHAGQRRFGRYAPHPGNNRRQRPAD